MKIRNRIATSVVTAALVLSAGAGVANARALVTIYDSEWQCRLAMTLSSIGGGGVANRPACIMQPTTDPANAKWGLYVG